MEYHEAEFLLKKLEAGEVFFSSGLYTDGVHL